MGREGVLHPDADRVPSGQGVPDGDGTGDRHSQEGGDRIGIREGATATIGERARVIRHVGLGGVGHHLIPDAADQITESSGGFRLPVRKKVANGLHSVGPGLPGPAPERGADLKAGQVFGTDGSISSPVVRIIRREVDVAILGMFCDNGHEACPEASRPSCFIYIFERDWCA